MSEPTTPATEVEEVVPDYSRVGFRDLQKLCKARRLSGEGGSAALVERLKQYDLQHGKDIDLSALDDSDPDFDPLADEDETVSPATPEQPTGGGQAASDPPPAGPAAPAPPAEPAAPRLRRGQPDTSTRTGVHVIGQGSQGPSRAYRAEFPIGDHELSDSDHFRYIADTHAQAQAAGYTTRGGSTIGERVGYAITDGRRVVIYQVTLKREL